MSDTVARTRRAAPERDPAVRTRRRFLRRQWRRRWLRWRYLLAGLVVVGLAAGAVWALYFSSLLAVDRVEVVGASALGEDEVRDAAQVRLAEPLARTDLDAARLRVGSLALVESVEVTRRWPSTVVVTLTERTPIAVVALGDQLRGLDEDGRVLPTLPDTAAPLPRVLSADEVSSDALAEAAHVVAAMPTDLAAAVDHVEVETVDRIVLELRAGGAVQWGSADQSEQKARVLAALLQQAPAQEYDVSVPGLPTTRN